MLVLILSVMVMTSVLKMTQLQAGLYSQMHTHSLLQHEVMRNELLLRNEFLSIRSCKALGCRVELKANHLLFYYLTQDGRWGLHDIFLNNKQLYLKENHHPATSISEYVEKIRISVIRMENGRFYLEPTEKIIQGELIDGLVASWEYRLNSKSYVFKQWLRY